MEDGVKVFRLVAEPVSTEFAPGRVVDVWGFNGSILGPTIEVNQGDRVRFIVENDLPELFSIHWHGLEVPIKIDGVPGLTQDPIPPGGRFVYEFTLHQQGTFFYHSHMPMQEMMGMVGLFIIHPTEPYAPRVDRDFGLIFQEWAILPNNTIPNTLSMEFNWLTINGKAGQAATLAAEAVGVSQQLFNVGAADRPDLLAGEIEAQQAQLELVAARNRQDRTWRRLAQVVGDPTLVRQPLDGRLDAVLPMLDRERALETLVRDSPELKAARAGVERAQLALQRARKEPIPDLVVRAGPWYNRELLEPGRTPVGWEAFADVGVAIPLFNRNQGNVEAARAELARARAEVVRLELVLRARFADVFDQYSTARQRGQVYRTEIVPRAEEAHNLFLARFRETAAAYPQVLIAQRTLLQVTESYLDVLEAGWGAVVQIQGLLLMGGLDAPAMLGEAPSSAPGMAFSPGELVGAVSSGFQDS